MADEREKDPAKTDATKTSSKPDSTWGATEAAKEEWAKKYGKDKKDEAK